MSAFERTELLLGTQSTELLSRASVAVFGIGGVGSFAAEAIARAGVGNITLIDGDVVSESNKNRQLIALSSTVGMAKAQVMAQRVHDINPSATVHAVQQIYTPQNGESFNLSNFDYIIDAIDTVSSKVDLIVRATALGVPIISCMGTGNKLDPTALSVSDIYSTEGCPLARVLRKKLRAAGVCSLRVVWSSELPQKPLEKIREGGRYSLPGSVPFVPPVAGFIAAGEAIKHIIGVK